jgi:hypothetical protein
MLALSGDSTDQRMALSMHWLCRGIQVSEDTAIAVIASDFINHGLIHIVENDFPSRQPGEQLGSIAHRPARERRRTRDLQTRAFSSPARIMDRATHGLDFSVGGSQSKLSKGLNHAMPPGSAGPLPCLLCTFPCLSRSLPRSIPVTTAGEIGLSMGLRLVPKQSLGYQFAIEESGLLDVLPALHCYLPADFADEYCVARSGFCPPPYSAGSRLRVA